LAVSAWIPSGALHDELRLHSDARLIVKPAHRTGVHGLVQNALKLFPRLARFDGDHGPGGGDGGLIVGLIGLQFDREPLVGDAGVFHHDGPDGRDASRKGHCCELKGSRPEIVPRLSPLQKCS